MENPFKNFFGFKTSEPVGAKVIEDGKSLVEDDELPDGAECVDGCDCEGCDVDCQ